MKKAFLAIVLFIAGLGFAVPTFMNGVNYYSRKKAFSESTRKAADESFQNALLCGIGSLTTFSLAVVLWVVYKREEKVRLD